MRLAVAGLVGLVGVAHAAPAHRLTIPIEPEHVPARIEGVSNVIYLERCTGGCRVTNTGTNDAASSQSTIPMPGIYNLTEFENTAGETGAAADTEWDMVVQCIREVYSPFNVTVTDQRPAAGSYHVAIIAGQPPELGFDFSVLGVGLFASNCAALDNVMSFSFANAHMQDDPLNRVHNICWTASQEIAHSFGLDHQYEFVKDGRSACNDPMTYRFDCGGQKFFRNAQARCGEDEARACRCGATQNSHKKLLSVFGAGTPITGAPAIQMTNPQPGATALPDNVIGLGSSQRGIAKVELYMNGFPFIEVNGALFGPLGQGEQSYGLVIPRDTPTSIYDIFIRAHDDLGAFTDTPTQTVMRGGPCTASEACLPHQACNAGRCEYPPSVGEFGDACEFPQYCKSLLCAGPEAICTQACEPEDPEGCPAGMSCQNNVCFFAESGCCSTGRDGWAGAGLLVLIVGFTLRRRR